MISITGRSLFSTLSIIACSVATPCAVAAHTAYLLPSTFAVSRDHVGIQAAMTEDIYFAPEFPVRASAYEVIAPDGQKSRFDTGTMTKDMAVLDVPITTDGTYRITTGAYVARTSNMAKIDGRWHATPLFIALLFLEATDIIFAVDSVPAIFAITSEPMIVFTSNIFAILGLRSMYFMLAGVIDKFHLLKYGLAATPSDV